MKTSINSANQFIRPASCAGRFYPADAGQLRRNIETCLAAVSPRTGGVPKAIIAPHAGYVYSGPIAASAYACLRAGKQTIRRVVVLGPSHYSDFEGVATSAADAFESPLGVVPLDAEAIAIARELPQVIVSEEAHLPEHSIEVHLPFLQVVLESFRLVPLLVGQASEDEMSEVLDLLWGGEETVIVVSSDLSHYHDYATACKLDLQTSRAIESLAGERIENSVACGCRPIRGLLRAARQHHLRCRNVDLRNSGDTAGSRDRVVGYGAFVLAGSSREVEVPC